MQKPEVSVIVVNRDRRDLLKACLDSLSRQEGVGLEVILVDNGSRDSSVEMAQSGCWSFPLRIIRNDTNRGFCAANNQGISVARGAWIALLNNDAEAESGWVSQLLAACRELPEAGMAASKVLSYEDPSRIDKAGHLIYPDGQNWGRGHGEVDRGQYDVPGDVLWPDGCAALYRKAMLDEIGGFDEDFFAYGDDAELGLRARIAGWRCVYAPGAVVRHHRGSTLGLDNPERVRLIERNRVLLAVKHFPWSLLIWNVPFYLARLGAGIAAAWLGEAPTSHFHGLRGKLSLARSLAAGDLAAVALVPRMLGKRRRMAGIRKLSPARVRRLILDNRVSLRAMMEA